MADLLLEESTKGSYAAVTFSDATVKRLVKFCADNNIPKALKPHKYHTTLLYSKKHLPDYEAQGKLKKPWIGTPARFDVWDTQPKKDGGETTRCLVLVYKCKALEDRHNELMDEHGATYDFDQYHSHITLSYDIGSLKIKGLTDKIGDIGDIEIVNEYGEDLNLDWAIDAS